MVNEHPKQWDQELQQAKFTYNDSPNRCIGLSLFQIVYGMHPRVIYELRNLGNEEMRSLDAKDFSTTMQSLHEYVKQQLKGNNSRYK